MSQERSEAIVLRGVDFSESSLIVTFLTPNRGKLACMARGAKRSRNNTASLLDTFNRVEIVYAWKDGRGVQTLAETTLVNRFSGIKNDMEKMTYGAFPLEVGGKLTHENEPSDTLYETLVDGMERLDAWTGDVALHACWQTLQLLEAGGYAPSVDACSRCGAVIDLPRAFSKEGGAVCIGCKPNEPLTPSDSDALLKLARSKNACPGLECAGALTRLLSAYASWHLESDLRSMRVIHQVFG